MSTYDRKPLAAILLSIATVFVGYVAAAPFLDLASDMLLPLDDLGGAIPGQLAAALRSAASFDTVQAATDFYVSPTGHGKECSFRSPCDIITATCSTRNGSTDCPSVMPRAGDRIWLRGGTYNMAALGQVQWSIGGEPGNPITIRNYMNEHVFIDCNADFRTAGANSVCWGAYVNKGHDVRLWGLDFGNSSKAARANTVDDKPPVGFGNDVSVGTQGDSMINCFNRNNANGAVAGSSWGGGKLFYGNFSQYAGYTGTHRGHGHSWYIQNPSALGEAGRTTFQDNIALRSFDIGIHIYAQEGNVAYVTLDHNVEAVEGHRSSASPPTWDQGGGQTLIHAGASGQMATNCDPRVNPKVNLSPIVNGNMTYDPTNAYSLVMGYNKGSCDATVTNNYFASHNMIEFTKGGTRGTVTITGNTFMATPNESGGPAPLFTRQNFATNTYLSGFPDSGKQLFYRPNRFEAGRGFVVVYNWDHSPTVTIDLAQMGATPGEDYRLFNYQDNDPWNSTPVTTGTCANPCGKITVPTTASNILQPGGTIDGTTPFPKPPDTGPEFTVFLVYPRWSSVEPTSPAPPGARTEPPGHAR